MDKENFCKEIQEFSAAIKQELNEEQCLKFYDYMEMLLDWNEKINLTAITDPKEIIIKHFIDSITIKKYISEDAKVIDVGTGAGFPGIPLKISDKTLHITLLDSLNKRIKFLDEVITSLQLKDIKAVHARVEEFGKNKLNREKFDYATSRAVAKLNVLAEYMLPLVKVGGTCICMKGPEMEQEIEESKNAIKVLGGKIERKEQFVIPNTDIKRTVVILKKEKPTPNKYPRKPGMAVKSPLN